jgi:hypothetical protein
MSIGPASRHLGDDDLIRYIDHQPLDREGARRARAHLAACAECAARLEAMQSKSASVHAALAFLGEAEAPTYRRAATQEAMDRARFRGSATAPISSRVAWRAAAAVLVLASVVGFGTEPGQAFVRNTVGRLTGGGQTAAAPAEQSFEVEAAPPAPAAAAPGRVAPPEAEPPARRPAGLPPGMSALVRFSPAGRDVLLRFESQQEVGGVSIRFRDNMGQATAQVVTGYEGERLVPTQDEVVVRNRRDSRADYAFEIPARYRFVRLRVANGPEVLIPNSRAKREWLWTIPLQDSVPLPR